MRRKHGFGIGPLSGAITLALGILALLEGHVQRELVRLLPYVIVFGAGSLLLPMLRSFFGDSERLHIELGRLELELPRAIDDPRMDRIPLEDIDSLVLRREDSRGLLFIGTRLRSYFFPLSSFIDRLGGLALYDALRLRIGALPRGASLLSALDARGEASRAALVDPCIATKTLLVLLGCVYAVERAMGADSDVFMMVRLGANARALVFDGQWYRLLSASFLHASVGHLLMNASALVSLGFVVERLLGRARYLIVYLASAFLGALSSALVPRGAISAGASTAVFGLLGALAFLTWRYQEVLPAGFRTSRENWVIVFGLNALLPIAVPQIDVSAHLGGLLGGALVTAIVSAGQPMLPLRAHRGTRDPAFLSALVWVALSALGLGLAALHARCRAPEDELAIAMDPVHARGPSRALLHAFAWRIASAADASPRELFAAESAARAALEAEGTNEDVFAVRDTLATLAFRRGDVERAIALEAEVLDGAPNDFYATQLLRFLDARSDRDPLGVYRAEVLFDPTRDTLAWNLCNPSSDARLEEAPTVERPAPLAERPAPPQLIYAVVRDGPARLGLLRLLYDGPFGEPERLRVSPLELGRERWSSAVTVRVGLVRTGTGDTRVFVADRAVLGLP